MTEKRKHQPRMHSLIFLAGWTGILIIGWIFALLGFLEISWFLPHNVRQFFRNMLSVEVRENIRLVTLVIIGFAIPTAQRLLLNRGFGLHLSSWWIILTFFGYVAGFFTFWVVGQFFPTNSLEAIIWTWLVVSVMGIPAFLQWCMLHRRWRYSWVWIIVSLISGGFILSIALRLFIDFQTYYAFKDAIDLIPVGMIHGLLTGLTAIILDKYAGRST